MLFQGAAFCPHCGSARQRVETGDAAGQSLRCPACRGEMQWIRLGSTDLLECQQCDGTWIEAAVFERLCSDRESQTSLLPKAPSPARTSTRPRVKYRPCPLCGKMMNRLNFGRLSGAIVDVCRGHGTFLDRGELHQVVQFIVDGGLDRARRAGREELAEEERRLRLREAAGGEFNRELATSLSVHELLRALIKREIW
jgi:Zn-finger nucleic acid-binding protein